MLSAEVHRKVAAYLWRKAAAEPDERRRLVAQAELHAHLARAQDEHPALRPRRADIPDINDVG